MKISKLKNYNSINNTRYCKKCKNNIDLSKFSTRIKTLKNNEEVLGYREICKDCSINCLKNALNPSTLENRRAAHRKNPIRRLLNSARARAKKNNLEFNITKRDLKIPKICPILEIPISVADGHLMETSPSIDRIDNNKGYIKGNVIIISHKANTCKNSLTLEELKVFATNILRVLNKLDELREQPEVVNPDLSINLND